jgi:hypothetical protein
MGFLILTPDKQGHWVEIHNADLMNESIMVEVDNWVRNNKLGKRMAFNMWKLKSKAAKNWFVLKWSK